MAYRNGTVNKFNQRMDKIIKTWEGYEEDFYRNIVVPGFLKDPFLVPFIGTKSTFPHNLFLLWVRGPQSGLTINEITFEKLEKLSKLGKLTLNNSNLTSVEKGKKFEDALATSLSKDFMRKVANAFPEKLSHVGSQNKREDFLISELYSIDAKYSDNGEIDRFRNMIKPWGSNLYSSIMKIEEGILRSMYREGSSQGQFRPTATGQTTNRGILKYNADRWEEVTQEDYDKYNFGKIPSLRKNIMYIFNDDGYWASYCLRQVVNWASQHLEDLGFTEYTKDPNYKSYDANEFWGFSNKDWEKRQVWYGSSNNK